MIVSLVIFPHHIFLFLGQRFVRGLLWRTVLFCVRFCMASSVGECPIQSTGLLGSRSSLLLTMTLQFLDTKFGSSSERVDSTFKSLPWEIQSFHGVLHNPGCGLQSTHFDGVAFRLVNMMLISITQCAFVMLLK